VIPLIVGLVGIALLGVGIAIVRSFGDRYRVGRLLAAAPAVTILEALELAGTGRARYVRVSGRITSTDVFPDELDRPLVYRRTRLEVEGDGTWRVVDEEREAVDFALEERGDAIAIEAAALAEGLVVLPRIAAGTVADLPAGLSASVADPAAPARQRVEQVSAVEHAQAVGVPRRDGSGGAILGPGLGRPLILTTLERDDAMRVLAEGRAGRLRAALLVGALGLGLLLAGALGAVMTLAGG
jgi:hypothetical protein